MNRGVQHAAHIGTHDGAGMHADADEATRELVHDHETVAPAHRLAAKEVHAPEAVGGVADARPPRGPASARSRASGSPARDTRRVYRRRSRTSADDARNPGQPKRGLRDLSSTIAWMSARSALRAGLLGHDVDENGRRYLRQHATAPRPDETPGASRGGGRWRPGVRPGLRKSARIRRAAGRLASGSALDGGPAKDDRLLLSRRFSAIPLVRHGAHSFAVKTAR